LNLVAQLALLFLSRQFFGELRTVLVRWLELTAGVLKSGSVAEERLVDSGSWEFCHIEFWFFVVVR
jgi:hypothetical protein